MKRSASKRTKSSRKYPAALRNVPTKPLRQAVTVNDGNDDYMGWRPFGSKLLSNDIAPQQREQIVKISRALVKRDPISKRALQIPIEAIDASGYFVQAEDETVENYLNDFLEGCEEKLSLFYFDRLINGDLCVTIKTNPINGQPYFGYIDTRLIEAVEYSKEDFTKAEVITVRQGMQTQSLRVIKFYDGPEGMTWEGDCFYWSNITMLGMSRGLPELTAETDYTQLFEVFMRNTASRSAYVNTFLWLFRHKGKDEAWIENWLNKNFPEGSPPGPAAFFAGNEGFEIESIAPNLQSADSATAGEMLGQHIFAGLGFPTFYFGKGENTNVATAREIAIPTTWKLKRHQKQFRRMAYDVCALYYCASLDAGVFYEGEPLPRLKTKDWKITCGEIYPRDMVQAAQVFGQLMSSVATSQSNGTLPQEVRNEVTCVALRELGIERSPKELAKLIEQEELEREAEDETKRLLYNLPPKNGKLNGAPTNGEMDDPSYAELIRMGVNPYSRKAKRRRALAY